MTNFDGFEMNADNPRIFLCPVGLDAKKTNIENNHFRYRIRQMSEEDLQRNLQIANELEYIYATPESFWAVP
jgi:hypothetical protein